MCVCRASASGMVKIRDSCWHFYKYAWDLHDKVNRFKKPNNYCITKANSKQKKSECNRKIFKRFSNQKTGNLNLVPCAIKVTENVVNNCQSLENYWRLYKLHREWTIYAVIDSENNRKQSLNCLQLFSGNNYLHMNIMIIFILFPNITCNYCHEHLRVVLLLLFYTYSGLTAL